MHVDVTKSAARRLFVASSPSRHAVSRLYDDVKLTVLGCRADTDQEQTVTNACAWFNVALRPQKP